MPRQNMCNVGNQSFYGIKLYAVVIFIKKFYKSNYYVLKYLRIYDKIIVYCKIQNTKDRTLVILYGF